MKFKIGQAEGAIREEKALVFWLEKTSDGIMLKCREERKGHYMGSIVQIMESDGKLELSWGINPGLGLSLDSNGKVEIS